MGMQTFEPTREQRAVIEHEGSHLLVFAGPGTGKTETLARRFAHLPSVGLRDLVFHVGPGAVETFFSHSEPALAKELHEAAERSGVGILEPAD